MAVERAAIRPVFKPWGRADLKPWSDISMTPERIGELWFARPTAPAPVPGLLFKLIFADEPLSIQVHPDDAFAEAHGMPNGKTEAWYILSAVPDAQVAVGLNRSVSGDELRSAIADESIAGLVAWRPVRAGDVISIPAGTIHAIGAGVTLAEIQQNSDATFRIYDFERGRKLHVEEAVSASIRGRSPPDETHSRLDRTRDVLVENSHFVLERIDLPPLANQRFLAERETMMFVLSGSAAIGLVTVEKSGAVFVGKGDDVNVETGTAGMSALVSYPGPLHVACLFEPVTGVTDNCLAPAGMVGRA